MNLPPDAGSVVSAEVVSGGVVVSRVRLGNTVWLHGENRREGRGEGGREGGREGSEGEEGREGVREGGREGESEGREGVRE